MKKPEPAERLTIRNKDLRESLPDRWRDRIASAQILTRLVKHFNGELDPPLDAGQIQVGLALMRKVLPDLKAMEITGTVNHRGMSKLELDSRLASLGYDPGDVWQAIENRHKIAKGQSAIGTEPAPIDAQVIDSTDKNGNGSKPVD